MLQHGYICIWYMVYYALISQWPLWMNWILHKHWFMVESVKGQKQNSCFMFKKSHYIDYGYPLSFPRVSIHDQPSNGMNISLTDKKTHPQISTCNPSINFTPVPKVAPLQHLQHLDLGHLDRPVTGLQKPTAKALEILLLEDDHPFLLEEDSTSE